MARGGKRQEIDAGLGLRERNKRRTRERIETVGLALMTRRGFDDVSVEEIAAAAGISPRTFYRYYPTKDELVFATQADDLAVLREHVRVRAAKGVDTRAVVDAVADFAGYLDGRRTAVLQRSRLIASNPALFRRGLGTQREWAVAIEEEILRVDPGLDRVSAAALAGTAIAILEAAFRSWIKPRGRDLREQMLTAADHVLGTAKPFRSGKK